MRAKRLSLVLLCAFMVFAAAPAVRQALAEDAAKPADPGLSDVLTDLLHGVEGENATSGPDKRVPFGREEVQLSFAPLVKQTAPAVVNVYASQTAKVTSPFEGDPFFEEFFGRAQPRAQSSLGSGVLVDPSGVIVTNFHVIKDADEVKVATADGREFTSKVMLKDETLDLAVLKIESDKPFPVIAIGDSDALEVGDFVLAIGNPFGLGQTVTSGIVSALGRSGLSMEGYEHFIQTDAPINPGNSGGALINLKGELVGINSAIIGPAGGNVGIGFAVPAVMARAVMAQLIKFGEVRRGRLGISMQDVTGGEGAQIAEVLAGSPAAEAGLRKGDVVIAINGRPVRGSAELRARLGVVPAGETVELQVRRGSESQLVKARIAELEKREAAGGEAIAELGGAMLANGEVGRTRGVLVSAVEAGSAAFGHGLRTGDLIVGVNQRRVTSVSELANVLRASERVTLNVLRGEHQLAVPVR